MQLQCLWWTALDEQMRTVGHLESHSEGEEVLRLVGGPLQGCLSEGSSVFTTAPRIPAVLSHPPICARDHLPIHWNPPGSTRTGL